MDKGIGFRRNIRLEWLEATAALRGETDDVQQIRDRLETIVAIESRDNRRVAIDILVNIWVKSVDRYPRLQSEAITLYRETSAPGDRLWLHYGLAILTYPFFRLGGVTIGQLSRYSETVTPKDIKKRMVAELGELGALDKAVERIVFSLRDWGLLIETSQRYAYAPPSQRLTSSTPTIEMWLLEAALTSHPAEELPFADLVRLPELFPFHFSVGVDDLRQSPSFEVQRQGVGWDMVRVVDDSGKVRCASQMIFV